MRYGQRPEGMSEREWFVECQCRHVAREMHKGRDRAARLAIFEKWQKALPAVTKERAAQIWREGQRNNATQR